MKHCTHDDESNNGSSSSSFASKTCNMTLLPEQFSPGPFDVICARGRDALMHPGNQRFRAYIVSKLDDYLQTRTKLEKSRIVSTILSFVRDHTPMGGFVKEKGGRWYEVGDHLAREKVGQAFRDLLHIKYKSSARAKKIRSKMLMRIPIACQPTDAPTKTKVISPRNQGTTWNGGLTNESISQMTSAILFHDMRSLLSESQSSMQEKLPHARNQFTSTPTLPLSVLNNRDCRPIRSSDMANCDFVWKAEEFRCTNSLGLAFANARIDPHRMESDDDQYFDEMFRETSDNEAFWHLMMVTSTQLSGSHHEQHKLFNQCGNYLDEILTPTPETELEPPVTSYLFDCFNGNDPIEINEDCDTIVGPVSRSIFEG